ncbi:MAG: zinc ribbon domain-containing protein [Slackia sp.]|nr:zinc ribbon domain-containing protein [Slackia sp.]
MAYRQPAAPYTRPAPTVPVQGSYAPSTACPRCGSAIPAGSKFCLACGQKVGGGFCAGCGAALPADARFCPSCGTPRR